jgi:glycosyltransferase involved in cell wall biosynthesis
MACGKPVISSGLGGAAEILRENYSRICDGHAPAWAEAISSLIADPEERVRLGANGRMAAKELFSRERMNKRFVSVYEAIAEAAPRGALAVVPS